HLNGWSQPPLQQAADLASAINHGPKDGRPKLVFDANIGKALPSWPSHHATAPPARQHQGAVRTGLNLLCNLSPISKVNLVQSLELTGRYPDGSGISGNVGHGGFWAHAHGLSLPHSLETERKAGCDCLKIVADINASQAAIQNRGIVGRKAGSKVLALVFILKGNH